MNTNRSPLSVHELGDGCWYVLDKDGYFVVECGRWGSKEKAQEEARKYILGINHSYTGE